ncbi:MAG: SGNH/GDSL hydrolase family protein [Rariglobus sp.]
MKTSTPFLRLSILGVVSLGLLGSLSAQAADTGAADFFFRDGDRAMILGDSITQQRQYSTFVESFVLSRFPDWKITFRNTGWSGDTMGLRTRGGIDAGFERDLKPLAPTAVTIDFGMNDARAGAKGTKDYVGNAGKLADKFAALGTRVAFVTSSAEERYQEGQPAGSAYNTMLRTYSEGLKQVAAEKNLPFVNQLDPMIDVIEKGREVGVFASKEGGARLVPDGVHPNWEGSFVMAVYILKGLNAPALVSSVEIDAKSGAVKAEKAVVTEVKTGDALSFTRLDAAMPWPVSGEVANVLKVAGFNPFDDLSRYLLKVTGLTAASYRVAADDKPLGTFTREQLASGVNLTGSAFNALPEVKALFDAITAKNNLFYSRWRDVQVAQIPSWIATDAVEQGRAKRLAELDAQLAAADAKLDGLRKPQAHRWTITPVK